MAQVLSSEPPKHQRATLAMGFQASEHVTGSLGQLMKMSSCFVEALWFEFFYIKTIKLLKTLPCGVSNKHKIKEHKTLRGLE